MTSKYDVIDGFNTIARAYDVANDAMTFGLHRVWRHQLCQKASSLTPHGGHLLDLATGTGDVVMSLNKMRPDLNIIGADPAEQMLEIAKKKAEKVNQIGESRLKFKVADGRKLPFKDNSFDTITISWGIRNIEPMSLALREVLRVLKPGGYLAVLESGKPELSLVRFFHKQYSKLLPVIGKKLSGYRKAYDYYVETAEAFPSGQRFVAELFDCGFLNGRSKSLTGGIVYLYTAQKAFQH